MLSMKMRSTRNLFQGFTFVFLFTLGFNVSMAAGSATCACPPHYCISVEAEKAKQAKKAQAIRKGLPARLAAYFDKLPNCLGCVEKAPSWPTVTVTYDEDAYEKKYGDRPGSGSDGFPWSRHIEQSLRDGMRDGYIKKFSITISEWPCRCCPKTKDKEPVSDEKYFRDSAGWDSDLNVHAGQGEIFKSPGQLGADPKDLTTLSGVYQRPSIRQPKRESIPPIRVVQAQCPECESIADEYNDLGTLINTLNKKITNNKRNLAIIKQAIRGVRLEQEGIGSLGWTEKTKKMSDALEVELNQRIGDRDRTERKIANTQKAVSDMSKQLEEILQRLKGCDKKCVIAKEKKQKIAVGTVLGGAVLLALSSNSGGDNNTNTAESGTAVPDSVTSSPDPEPTPAPDASVPGGRYNVSLGVASNPANHPILLQQLVLVLDVVNTALVITQLTNNPNFPSRLTGSLSSDGNFTAIGNGTYSGFSTVFQMVGTILALQQNLSFILTVGGNGSLPTGQPITYNGSGTK